MTNPPDDLPATPAGISFDEWAALLTGGTTGGSSEQSSTPGAQSDRPAPATPTSADAMTAALEASWRESLRQEALHDAAKVQHPDPEAPAPQTVAPQAAVPQAERKAEAMEEYGQYHGSQPPAPDFTAPNVPASDFRAPSASAPGYPQPEPAAPDAAVFRSRREERAATSPTGGDSAQFAPPPLQWSLDATPAAEDVTAELAAQAPAAPAPTPPVPAVQVQQLPDAAAVDNAPPRRVDPAPQPAIGEAQRATTTDGADADLIAALEQVVLLGASDLHVTANTAPTIRLHGGLQQLPAPVWTPEKVRAAVYSILAPDQKQRFERELELDFAYEIGEDARFRVNVYQQRESVGAAFRLIPTEIKTLAQLGVPESVARFATLPRGLVLVTGPTGSGKSTTLAALIDVVNTTRADHIMTVEDPIEFMHEHKQSLINQREVGHDTHSFASALKHVLRQDPDVILVGELRDLETISVALTAAETGHLVFATLHTQSAAQTIDRIIDVFPPHQQGQVRTQLASTLRGVVTQTLVKRAGGVGRVVATEVLVTTPAVSNLIREGKTYQVASAMQAGRDQGMHTLDQHLADLVDSGQITQQAGLEKSLDAESFMRLVQRTDTGGAGSGYDLGDPLTDKAW
jgi:twitching motility protein PilT